MHPLLRTYTFSPQAMIFTVLLCIPAGIGIAALSMIVAPPSFGW